MIYSLNLTTPATEYPLLLEEAKASLRVTTDDENSYIQSLIAAATGYVEQATARQLVSATWTLKLDYFPAIVYVPRPPLRSVTSIQYVDTAGDTQTLASTGYRVDTATLPGRIEPAYGESWPSTRDVSGAVTVTFIAGYGGASSVPEEIKLAMRLMVGHWYEHREPVAVGNIVSDIPMSVDALLSHHRFTDIR